MDDRVSPAPERRRTNPTIWLFWLTLALALLPVGGWLVLRLATDAVVISHDWAHYTTVAGMVCGFVGAALLPTPARAAGRVFAATLGLSAVIRTAVVPFPDSPMNVTFSGVVLVWGGAITVLALRPFSLSPRRRPPAE